MKRVTAISFFTTTEGVRIAIRYSVINAQTGEIDEANKHIDRVLLNDEMITHVDSLMEYAQTLVDSIS